MQIILQNGRVVDPKNGVDERRDIGIVDGRITDPSHISKSTKTKLVDVSNLVITPGLIDMHVHLREPGFEYKEDIASGSQAAAAGGFTSIVAMPNTHPAIDSLETVHDVSSRIQRSSSVHTYFCSCITKGRLGKQLVDFESIHSHPLVVGFSDDGDCVENSELMRKASLEAKKCGMPIIDHCEDRSIWNNGVVRLGPISQALDIPGMPAETESNMVHRDIDLSKTTGAKFHIQHVSTAESIKLIRKARQKGIAVTAEVSPHHLCLTNEIIPIIGTSAKMNPPLGNHADRTEILEGISDGTISVLATDHAPHAPREKANSLAQAPFGIIGLETAIPICYTELVDKGILSLMNLISMFTIGPASVTGINAGTLTIGESADVTILDLNKKSTIDITRSYSKSRNSPFHNMNVIGEVVGTICSGKWVYQRDE